MVAIQYAYDVLDGAISFDNMPVEEGENLRHNDDLVRSELRAVAASLKARLERFEENPDA